jgi:predicted exporter
MNRNGALLWLGVVVAAGIVFLVMLGRGIVLQSDILALLPPTERDVAAQHVQNRIAKAFSRRVVFLVGHRDAATARKAALALTEDLSRSGLVASITSRVDQSALQRMGAAYFPYRTGLLAEADRDKLIAGHGDDLVSRALGLLYGPAAPTNAQMIAHDPFLLLPSLFLSLPLPQSRLSAEDGVLSLHDGPWTYVLVSADLAGDPYALRFQTEFTDLTAKSLTAIEQTSPGLKVMRTGAVFFAHDAANEAMSEASTIGVVSLVATLAMIFVVFRGLRPIALGFLAIGIGILFAFVGTALVFGGVHTIALLFGASLIGVSVDYALQYFCEYFDPDAPDPRARLMRVLPGVSIGLFTTLIGYCTLLLAPFPGLRQVAVFSLVGLIASVLTVALWFPLLDSKRPPKTGSRFVALARYHWVLWEKPGLEVVRILIVAGCLVLGLIGAAMLRIDDDVRHFQSLSPELKTQQAEVERLTGSSPDTRFLLVRGDNEQHLLQLEERMRVPLARAQRRGALDGFTAISDLVPSIARQKENRRLVQDRLVQPHLASYLGQIGYAGDIDYSDAGQFLVPSQMPRTGLFSLLGLLDVGDAQHSAHIVLLQGVHDPVAIREAIAGTPGVRLVSLTDDWSRLFGDYRRYAIGLLILSALLMYPIHAWRYGWLNALRVMTPSMLAVGLAAPLAALAGVAFTFFNAMALVLVLSIGVDYAIFCRETSGERKPVTVLAISLAALSTILAFGMLALSQVFAVHAFGMTMLLGISVAFLLAPLAGSADGDKDLAAP